MPDFKKDDPVWVPDPDGEGELPATFVGLGDPEDAIENDAGIRRDVAWVQYESGDREGSTGKVLYWQMRPRN